MMLDRKHRGLWAVVMILSSGKLLKDFERS